MATNYDQIIVQAANDLGVPPALALAVYKKGEQYNPKNPVSPKGATGPMQLMPGTFNDMAAKLKFENPDINNDAQNIYAGVAYLGEQLKRFGGNPILATAAYNSGPTRVEGSKGVPPIKETEDYTRRVLGMVGRSNPNATFTSEPLIDIDLPNRHGPFDPEARPPEKPFVFIPWEKIAEDKDYKALPDERKMKVKEAYFGKYIAPNSQYQSLRADQKSVLFQNFMQGYKLPTPGQEALQEPSFLLNPPELAAIALTGGGFGVLRAGARTLPEFAADELFPNLWKEAAKGAAEWTLGTGAAEQGAKAGGQVGRAVGGKGTAGDVGEFIGRALGGTLPLIGFAKAFQLFGVNPEKVKPEDAPREYQSKVDEVKRILSNPKEWLIRPKGTTATPGGGRTGPVPEPTWDELLSKYRAKGMNEQQATEAFFRDEGGMAEAARKYGGVRDWLREQQVRAAAAEKARQEARYGRAGGAAAEEPASDFAEKMRQHEETLNRMRQAAEAGGFPRQEGGPLVRVRPENAPAAIGQAPAQVPTGAVNPIMQSILNTIAGRGRLVAGQIAAPPNLSATGNTRPVYTPAGEELNVQFGVTDADNLITSHDITGGINRAYPAELQPRDRTRVASKAQIRTMANKINPELLGDSAKVSDGAPIIGSDNVVESGNARTLALRQAYRQGKGADYRNWLIKNAGRFGLDPKVVAGMKNPVLVRLRLTDVPRAEFARQANQADIASMSPVEGAKADAARLSPDDLALLKVPESGNLLAPINRSFAHRFLENIGSQEAAQYFSEQHGYSRQLADRMQNAIFAKAYGDNRLLALAAEEADPDIKNIITALNIAAPEFAKAKAAGAGVGVLDITPHIVDAARLIQRAKTSGMGLNQFLSQQNMFQPYGANQVAIARFFDANKRSAKRIGEGLKAMAQAVWHEVQRAGNRELFPRQKPTAKTIIDDVLKRMEDRYEKEKRLQLRFGEKVSGRGDVGGEPGGHGRAAPGDSGTPGGRAESTGQGTVTLESLGFQTIYESAEKFVRELKGAFTETHPSNAYVTRSVLPVVDEIKGLFKRYYGLTREATRLFDRIENAREPIRDETLKQIFQHGLKGLSPKEAEELFFNAEEPGKYPVPPNREREAQFIRATLDYLGDELVRRGMLKDLWPQSAINQIHERIAELQTENAETRDKTKRAANQVLIKHLQDMQKRLRGMRYVPRIFNPTATEKIKNAILGRINRGPEKLQSELRRFIGRQQFTLQDWLEATEGKGERITDIRVALADYMAYVLNKVAVYDGVEGFKSIPELVRKDESAPKDWVKVPQLKQLSGWRVHPLMARALKEFAIQPEPSNVIMRGYDTLNRIGKSIVFYNPFIHAGINDITQMYSGGALFSREAGRATKDVVRMLGGEKLNNLNAGWVDVIGHSDLYRRAQSAGLFSVPFERMPNVQDLAKLWIEHETNPANTKLQKLRQALEKRMGRKINPADWKNPLALGKDAYALSHEITWTMDRVWRMTFLRHLMDDKGMSLDDAVQQVKKVMADYTYMPNETRKWLNRVFLAPTYRVGMARFYYDALRHPVKNVGTLSRMAWAKFLIYALAPLAGYTWMEYYHLVRRKKDGTEEVIALPGPMFEMEKWLGRSLTGTLYLNLARLPYMAATLKVNRDYKGQEVYHRGDPPSKQLLDMAHYIFSTYLAPEGMLENLGSDDMDTAAKALSFLAITKYARDNSRLREYGELARAARDYIERVAPRPRAGHRQLPTPAEKAAALKYYRERIKEIEDKYNQMEKHLQNPIGTNLILKQLYERKAPAS